MAAQLYATSSVYGSQYPRACLRISSSSVSDSRHETNHHIQLNLGNTRTKQTSSLGLYAMNGGEGQFSYAQNSCYQGGAVDAAKSIIEEEIAAKLDNNSAQAKPAFVIADFGCSTGHNSFTAIQIITEAIEKKLQPEEFQVFFNDQAVNDFNTLFHSLPPQRSYHAAGVPSSFHDRIFPKASLDFAYSSVALNWLSRVPEEVEDRTHPAWNKGRIHYVGAQQEVLQAYLNQFVRDINSFLQARAEEVVTGGLMALLVPADPGFEISGASFTSPTEIQLLGSCLVDMANKGIISDEKVDTFNIPMYYTMPEELKAIIERNNSFGIERMEVLSSPGKRSLCSVKARTTFLRAILEVMLVNQFGKQVMDELFDIYTNKLEASPHFLEPANDKSVMIFILLKRKPQESPVNC